ncbi:hypothetical protein M3Y94_00015300 [Aphelenchoides besseyi]|nr:hypothetical protein M3Y94_00015300 [Aphelenchoides besseyi]
MILLQGFSSPIARNRQRLQSNGEKKTIFLYPMKHGKKAQVSTTLVINDQCTLKYEINDGHFKWTDETGKEVDSHSYFHSDLNFHGNGTLTSWDNKVTMCENKSLVNSLDDEWVWTKVRVIDLFDKYGFFCLS